MKKISLVFLTMMIFAGLILAACGGTAAPSTSSASAQPSPAITASPSDLQLDAANASSDNAHAAVTYLYEGLVKIADGKPAAALSQSWTVSEDGLDYIFNLRPAVTFHDSTALTADVVLANFNRWFDPANPMRGNGSFSAWANAFGGFRGETTADSKPKSEFDGIEKVNDLTVMVHLNKPDADFLSKLADPAFSIVSAAILAQGFGDGGSGSYSFVSKDSSSITLAPYTNYWDSSSIPQKSMTLPFP